MKNILKTIKEERQKNIASGAPFVLILSIVAFFLYIHFTNFSSLSLRETGVLGILNHDNTVKYCVGLVVLAFVFLLLRALTRWVSHRTSDILFDTELPRTATVIVFFAYLLFFGWYLQRYIFYTELTGGVFGAEPATFIWHQLPISLIVGYVGAILVWMLWTAFRGKDAQNATVYLVYGLAILISYITFIFINRVDHGDFHHGVAYLESIYNVYSGAPYHFLTSGIYGHYGIFFGILLKVFRGNTVMLTHMIALSGALSTAACAYVIHKLTKKNYLRIAAIFACIMSLTVLRLGNYWQVQPHRVLFPLLLVAFLTYLATKNAYTKPKIALGYLLCTLAVVWNTESGLFCSLAYTIAIIVHFYQSDIWYEKKMWLRYLTLIGGAVSTLVGAVLIVNLYNLTVGGGFILKDFFFPLGVDDYMNRVLKENLIGGAQVWILILALFVILLFLGLYHTKFFRQDLKEGESFDAFAPVFVALAVVGLLNFSYYANRAAYMNLDICSQTACLAMTVFADRFLENCRGVFRKKLTLSQVSSAAMSLLSLVVLTVMATQIVFCTHRLATKYEAGIFDVKKFEAQTSEFAEIVPEDYMVIGLGGSLYQLQLERPAKYFYRDISDLYVGGTEVSEVMVEDAVTYGKVAFYIIYDDSSTIDLMYRILSRANFTLTAEGTVGEAVVLCFEKQ